VGGEPFLLEMEQYPAFWGYRPPLFVRAKIFRICEELLDQSLDKIGDQNHLIRLSSEYLRLGQKFIKIVITLV